MHACAVCVCVCVCVCVHLLKIYSEMVPVEFCYINFKSPACGIH